MTGGGGGVSVIYRTVMTSHTIADVFRYTYILYSHALNRKKPLSAFSAKKGA
jgi:hypothetical protein